MNSERLVAMANDIAAFFAADPDQAKAVAGIAQHLTRFWAPRMRRQIIEHRKAGGPGLSTLAGQAVDLLQEP